MTEFMAKKNYDNGSILRELVYEFECVILNEKVHTYRPVHSGKMNVLDFIVASSELYPIAQNFIVKTDNDMSSDHVPILVELRELVNLPETQIEESRRFNCSQTDWRKFKQEASVRYLKFGIHEENVEKLNDRITESLCEAAKISSPISVSKPKSILPNYILELIRSRKKLRRQIEKRPTDNILKQLKSKLNTLTRCIRDEIQAFNSEKWSKIAETASRE